MLSVILTAAIIAGAAATNVDGLEGRNKYLFELQPYPANRTDSPDRAENGRLWHSRSPIGSRTPLREQRYIGVEKGFGRIGAAAFGAPPQLNDQIIYTRVNHVPVAISPWRNFSDIGFKNYRTAQNIWLREQGWVLNVRTHVNPRRLDNRELAAAQIQPRATIRLHRDPSAPTFPSHMRVRADQMRIWKPFTAAYTGPIRVLDPDEPIASTTTVAAVKPAPAPIAIED